MIYFYYLLLLMDFAVMQPTKLLFRTRSRNLVSRCSGGDGMMGSSRQWQPHDFTTMLRCFLRMTLLLLS